MDPEGETGRENPPGVAAGEPVEGGEQVGGPVRAEQVGQPRDAGRPEDAGGPEGPEPEDAAQPGCVGQDGCACEASPLESGDPVSPTAAFPEPAPPAARPLVSPALRSEILEYAQAFAIAIVLAAFIITFIAQSFVVEGSSMEPSLHNRERLLVNKLVYRFREPQRGDVVVFRYPANPKRKFIKRVIGVPGDVVAVRDGHVLLNGEVLEEGYTMDLTFGSFGPEVVPPGRYFVLGDNRNNSDDSRYPDVGFVPKTNIVGKAFVTWWPLGEIGLVRTPTPGGAMAQ